VREIAVTAGLSVGAVFTYFNDKEEILAYIFFERFERIRMSCCRLYIRLSVVAAMARASIPKGFRSRLYTISEGGKYTQPVHTLGIPGDQIAE
jgi:AcrR family transcriptional regulator